MYAKMALLMFYPYRTLKDLQIKKSYQNLFNKQRQLNIRKKRISSGRRALKYFKTQKTGQTYKKNSKNIWNTQDVKKPLCQNNKKIQFHKQNGIKHNTRFASFYILGDFPVSKLTLILRYFLVLKLTLILRDFPGSKLTV